MPGGGPSESPKKIAKAYVEGGGERMCQLGKIRFRYGLYSNKAASLYSFNLNFKINY